MKRLSLKRSALEKAVLHGLQQGVGSQAQPGEEDSQLPASCRWWVVRVDHCLQRRDGIGGVSWVRQQLTEVRGSWLGNFECESLNSAWPEQGFGPKKSRLAGGYFSELPWRQWSTTDGWTCPSCLFSRSEHSQKDLSPRRYHFTWTLRGWGSSSAIVACAAPDCTGRTGKGAVWPLFLRPAMLYLPSDSLHSERWWRVWDIGMSHQWDPGCLSHPKGVQIHLPSSHESAPSDSFWLMWVGHLLPFLLKLWNCAERRLRKGELCCVCSSFCDGGTHPGAGSWGELGCQGCMHVPC